MARLYLKTGTDRHGNKVTKGYYADFNDPARGRRRLSLSTKDERVARAKLVELERKQALGIWDPYEQPIDQKGVTLPEAVRRFLKDRERYCSTDTVSTYASVLKSFARTVAPGTTVRAVSTRHVKVFLTKPEYAGDLALSTRESYEDRLRIFFGWCEEQGLVGSNPVPEKERRGKAARAAAENNQPFPFFSEEEFLLLLSVIETDAKKKGLATRNQWLLDAVRFAVGTGLRRGEVAHLRWNAVDLESGLLHVRNTEEFTTKNGLERTVPLVGGAFEVVQQLNDERGPDPESIGGGYVLCGATGGKLGEDYVSKRFREYRCLAGLPENLSFHNLRHTFASWYVRRKGDLYHLKEILGHKDIKTTLRYAHLRPDALRAEMEHTFGAGLFGPSATSGDSLPQPGRVYALV